MVLLILLVLVVLVLSSEIGEILELRGSKSRGRTRLEWASEKKLGWKQRREVHVSKGCSRSLEVIAILVVGCKPVCVNGGYVRPLRMPVGIAGLVGRKGTVRKTGVDSIHLLGEGRLQPRPAWGIRGTIVMLHTEKMRGQEAVPRTLR